MGLYFFLSAASHGLLDALTDGGLGVAFFSPFDRTRYFFPVRPIAVSPIGIREFFSEQGLVVMTSELTWVWLPVVVLFVGLRALKRAATVTCRLRKSAENSQQSIRGASSRAARCRWTNVGL